MGLDNPVGLLAKHARSREIKEQLAGKNQALRAFEVVQHSVGVDSHSIHEPDGLREQVVGQNGRIGQNDALYRGMRNVAFVP